MKNIFCRLEAPGSRVEQFEHAELGQGRKGAVLTVLTVLRGDCKL